MVSVACCEASGPVAGCFRMGGLLKGANMRQYSAPSMELFELRPEEQAIATCQTFKHTHPFYIRILGRVVICPSWHRYGKGVRT